MNKIIEELMAEPKCERCYFGNNCPIEYKETINCSSFKSIFQSTDAEIKKHTKEINRAYDYLSACGVPKNRAGTLCNGIDVLVTRYRKEISLDAGEKAELRNEIKKLREQNEEMLKILYQTVVVMNKADINLSIIYMKIETATNSHKK